MNVKTIEKMVIPAALSAGVAYLATGYGLGITGIIDIVGKNVSASTAMAIATGIGSLGTETVGNYLLQTIGSSLPSFLRNPQIYEPVITAGIASLLVKFGSQGAEFAGLTPLKAAAIAGGSDLASRYASNQLIFPMLKL
jgi:hypothetical protein